MISVSYCPCTTVLKSNFLLVAIVSTYSINLCWNLYLSVKSMMIKEYYKLILNWPYHGVPTILNYVFCWKVNNTGLILDAISTSVIYLGMCLIILSGHLFITWREMSGRRGTCRHVHEVLFWLITEGQSYSLQNPKINEHRISVIILFMFNLKFCNNGTYRGPLCVQIYVNDAIFTWEEN